MGGPTPSGGRRLALYGLVMVVVILGLAAVSTWALNRG
ncbi:high-affinity Fe2+/Pb2+ permease [Kineococcus radiotolerans]|uniref:High-affinity Fe2+/Pb2+ permease n=1 Tax=Kineococcus radiotolerans TaxID=131568 RepID=A0A7W4XZ61_KINRA|nr:high-affinity Fe2+/Pb2+ permease [Kineococcus radiotolerans]